MNMNKIDDLMNLAKISEFIHRKEVEEEKKKSVCIVIAVIAGILAIAGIAFAVYKFISKEEEVFEDDFDEDDFEDDFDDDFDDAFEEDDFVKEEEPSAEKETEE